MCPWAIEMLANQNLFHKRRENLVKNFEHLGSCDAITIRFIVIHYLREDQGLRIGPMKLRIGNHCEERSRFSDTPDIAGNWTGSG
jgi:hypothetical protein